MAKKRITYKEAAQRFIVQGRDDIKLCKEGYNGWTEKSKFYDFIEKDYFWLVPYHVFKYKSCHPKRTNKRKAKKLSLSFEQVKERFKDRDDIIICKDDFNGWRKKSKFWDKVIEEYWWAIPSNVYNNKSCHPKRSRKIGISKRTNLVNYSFEETYQKFIDQGRDDIVLCKDGFNGWYKKSKFWDKEIGEYFWSVPYRVFKNKSSHPQRKYNKASQTYSLSFKEAQERFKDRDDIELQKEGYIRWSVKAIFWDKIEQKYFSASPQKVYDRKSCHPNRKGKNISDKLSISFEKAAQRFIDQGRIDIKLCKEGYIVWHTKAKFWDEVEQDYFWARPNDVYKRKSCHPKRSIRTRAQSQTISFSEAEKRFSDREDIKLIENGYNSWSKKSKFYDEVIKKDWYAIPDDVCRKKSCHPKRNKLSKAQIELFYYLKKEFISLEIMFEYKIVFKNKNYFVDIFIPTKNIIIEYNGDYWHCNPKLKRYNKNFFHVTKKKTAKEIWECDKIRKEELERFGYKVFIVWEYDYKHNKEQVLAGLNKEIDSIK